MKQTHILTFVMKSILLLVLCSTVTFSLPIQNGASTEIAQVRRSFLETVLAPVKFITDRLSPEQKQKEDEEAAKAQQEVDRLNAEKQKNCEKHPDTGCTFTPWSIAPKNQRWWRREVQ
ncbi:hypothetical protein BKA70DRAFT_676102 [Coprinopsis sp. MPI-PUGE-AT-0042]|nr:hypothetical protein BKA70DRAFT_676102 [Coprinopsis sp. MPI-PUGE-AT-0042]